MSQSQFLSPVSNTSQQRPHTNAQQAELAKIQLKFQEMREQLIADVQLTNPEYQPHSEVLRQVQTNPELQPPHSRRQPITERQEMITETRNQILSDSSISHQQRQLESPTHRRTELAPSAALVQLKEREIALQAEIHQRDAMRAPVSSDALKPELQAIQQQQTAEIHRFKVEQDAQRAAMRAESGEKLREINDGLNETVQKLNAEPLQRANNDSSTLGYTRQLKYPSNGKCCAILVGITILALGILAIGLLAQNKVRPFDSFSTIIARNLVIAGATFSGISIFCLFTAKIKQCTTQTIG